MGIFAFLLAGLGVVGPAGEAGDAGGGDLAIVGGRIFTAAGKIFEEGTVVIQGGKITAVGPRDGTAVPPHLTVISAGGRAVIPGLVDIWAGMPGGDSPGGEPHLRAGDLVGPFPREWKGVLSRGITTVGVAPVPSRGVGGLGAVLKLRSAPESGVLDLKIREDSHLLLALGLAPGGLGSPRITTAERLQQYYSLRDNFLQARQYGKAWNKYWEEVEKYNKEYAGRLASAKSGEDQKPGHSAAPAEEKPGPRAEEQKKEGEKKDGAKKPAQPPRKPSLDLLKEVFLRAVDGKLPVFLVAHRKADLGYALRLKEEFGLNLVLLGATDGYEAAAEIARSGTPVALGPALLTRWGLELEGHRESNGRDLAAAGVPLSLSSLGGSMFPTVALRLETCILVRGGLSRELALQAITSRPAEMLGLGDRLGTIEPGKDGDLVILNGDPLNALSNVVSVIVEGRVVMEREVGL